MRTVTLPNGQVRLWKPDLAPYESDVQLSADLKPNALGEYDVDGKSYIRQSGTVFQKQFDPQLKKWRLVHPSDPNAYQPILQHNGHGAWRHGLERPLEWDRMMLLRRLGPTFEHFSDAQLELIADASGVSDDGLRKVHIDHQAPPSQLTEMARLIEAHRQAEEVILQIRKGACLDGHCQFMVPLAVEMPNWPVEEVVEVFSGPEPWGTSSRFGSSSSASCARPTIKITQAEVDAGKLAVRILAALDEAQTRELLGSESTRAGVDRVQMLRDRLADQAQGRKKALFDNLLSRQVSPDADTLVLQRSFTSLSPEAAQQVLLSADAGELNALRRTGRIPLRLAKDIRVHVHQGSLSRALAGLSLESLASSASDRLALHSVARLPGWSPDIRVEVRLHGIRGPLVDSIGNEQASTRYYLIKGDDHFRAFDAEGRALNSVPRFGRNLFESLLQVVPEPLQRSLLGNPSEALQKQVVQYARTHRDDMSRILKRDSLKSGAGRLLRRPSGQFGYAASGDVAGFADESLILRMRHAYPNVSDELALRFIQARRLEGDTDQQIFSLLERRRRELEALCAVLDTWVADTASHTPRAPGWSNRRDIADAVIACWRKGFNRGAAPVFTLDMMGVDSLPQWTADFSHVSSLRLRSDQLVGNTGVLRQNFAALRRLDIHIVAGDMSALAAELSSLDSITELGLQLTQDSPELTQALQGMTQLEKLCLSGRIPALDYSELPHLQGLTLSGNSRQWPTGVLALQRLESLDLSGLEIPTLPDALFSGPPSLWRGLRLNWGKLEPEASKKAYEYVHENPAHLVDEPLMVAQYCHQRLHALVPENDAFARTALQTFAREGVTGRALLDQVDAMREHYRAWNQPLEEWQDRGVRVDGQLMSTSHRRVLADRLRACWRAALAARYASSEPVAGPSRLLREPVGEVLDLTGYGAPGDLPALGDTVFPQVRHLKLADAKLSATQVNQFLSHFSELRVLDLRGNRLTELPEAIEGLAQLTELNLSRNELTITAQAQARVNRLISLERLDLSMNRIGSLTVTPLMELVTLNLGATQIRAWPEGVLTLPRLGFLDLSRSAVSDIPDAVLVGHEALLAGTSLQGCRLSARAMTAAQAFASRNGPGTPLAHMFARPFGISRNALAAGRTEGEPMFFPPEVAQRPDLLLPLPVAGGLPMTSVARLQRIDPQLGTPQAIERINRWLAQEVGAAQIEAALTQWQEQYVQMIQRLNSWIDTPAVRSRDGWVSATDRRRAADRLLECWRESLNDVRVAETTASDAVLNLSGLTLGDLPALPVTFNHVGALDVSNVRLTTASNEFLRAFPRLNSLMLNGNDLGVLPEAIAQNEGLIRLGASHNDLSDADLLQRQLRSLPQLQVLDLEGNRLDTFDVTGLNRLQNLNLRGNGLSDWPVGVLQAPGLTVLNLRGNFNIEQIPLDALLPEHAALMEGTDLSDNLLLEDEFIRLREYQRETGRGLGFTSEEIDRLLAGYGPESEIESETDDEDLNAHPDDETPQVQKARWFEGVTTDSEKHAMWDAVMAQDTTGDFSNILAQLRHTQDFEMSRVDLTERVWEVIEAASGDTALSERLMGLSRASRHSATCGDGRMLLFNDLEVEVYEFNALRSVRAADRGRSLLKLSRGLFRLAELEKLAKERIRLNPTRDPAEIRLAYRLGLAQRLELPRQPKGMLFESMSGLTAEDLNTAYQTILDREKTPAFIEQLTSRQYWRDYLQEKYPTEFAKVQQALADKASPLEKQYTELNPEYLQQMDALQKANSAERQALMIKLSEREIAELGA